MRIYLLFVYTLSRGLFQSSHCNVLTVNHFNHEFLAFVSIQLQYDLPIHGKQIHGKGCSNGNNFNFENCTIDVMFDNYTIFHSSLFQPFTVLKPFLIPNQLYQIVLSFFNHLLCKIALNTQAEQNVNMFLVSPDLVSNMASKRYMAKIGLFSFLNL